MKKFKLKGKSPNGVSCQVWVCGECNRTALNEQHAEECCTCCDCRSPLTSEDHSRHGYRCSTCNQKKHEEREEKERQVEQEATIVEDYDGPIYCSLDNRYDENLESAYDHYIDEAYDLECITNGLKISEDELNLLLESRVPEFVFCCNIRPACNIDIEDIYDILINSEDFSVLDMSPDELYGCQELEEALKEFNSKNQGFIVYEPDFTRKVKLRGYQNGKTV
jgi:hypothetical protein